MFSDLMILIRWWSLFFLVGLIFLPASLVVFGKFFDKGYLFSKLLGVMIVSYFSWFLSACWMAYFSQLTILSVTTLFLALNIFIYYRTKPEVSLKHLKIFLFEELFFIIILCFEVYLRGIHPQFDWGEKYMDMGFINSILRSRFMPPLDIWYAGEKVNYYYFSHFVTALLIKISGIKPAVAFNIMVGTIAAFICTLSFSLVTNMLLLARKTKLWIAVFGGAVTATLLTWGGSLHAFIYAYFLPFLSKHNLAAAQESYFYPQASRYIGTNPPVADKTIVEFPSYTITISELHAHYFDSLNILLVLAMIFSLFLLSSKLQFYKIALVSIILSVILMTNTWDYPIYLGMALVAIFLSGGIKNNLKEKVLATFGIIFLSVIFSLPFLSSLKSMTSGVFFVTRRSRFYQLLVLWGYQVLLGLLFLGLIIYKKLKVNSSHLFFILLLTFGVILIAVPEVIYLKDIYSDEYQRANTMFKFSYNAFFLVTLAAGYAFSFIIKEKYFHFIARTGLIILIILPMLYTSRAIKGYYGNISPKNYHTLDGLDFLNDCDKDIIGWLDKKVSGQPNILEYPVDDYGYGGRISISTGLPAIIQWQNHEWLWRGGSAGPYKRLDEAKQAFESSDLAETRAILKKYDIKFIVYGEEEQSKLSLDQIEKFSELGELVYEKNQLCRIYSFDPSK